MLEITWPEPTTIDDYTQEELTAIVQKLYPNLNADTLDWEQLETLYYSHQS